MEYRAGGYDVAVIGAGHAGIEAALAAARLGARTVLFTMSLDAIGNMPCNPSIGGTAKGHLVREIDALGGEMAKAADATFIQSRMLNRGKGPAVHSLRAQADRKQYHRYMKRVLECQENLDLKQAEIVDIRAENGRVSAVVTALGAVYGVKAAVLCTGTYLRGKIFVGEYAAESGPDGMHAAGPLSDSLRALGLPLRAALRAHGRERDNSAASRPAPPRGLTAVRSTFPRLSRRRGTTRSPPSPLRPTRRASKTARSATWPTRTSAPMPSSAKISTVPPSMVE